MQLHDMLLCHACMVTDGWGRVRCGGHLWPLLPLLRVVRLLHLPLLLLRMVRLRHLSPLTLLLRGASATECHAAGG